MSKFPPSIKLLPPFVEAAAFLVVSWAKAALTVRRHLLFSNALSQAHHLFYPTWTVRRLTSGLISGKQALMLLDIRSLPRPTFSRMRLVQAFGDSVGFRSVHEDQPPILLRYLGRSRCQASHAVFASGLGHSLRRQTRRSSLNTSQTNLVA